MKKYFLLLFILCSIGLFQVAYGADEMSQVLISDAKMPVYNNGKLTIMAYSKTATRRGIDIVLHDAILDIIKPGVDVDQLKYVDGAKPYPLNASLGMVLKFWLKIIHSDGLIFSHDATINRQTKNARSQEKIFFRSPIMDIDGVGFRADFKKRTMNILSNVIIKIRQTGDSGKLMPGSKPKGRTSTSTITSDEMFLDFTNNIITVSGNVKVDEENITINCEKITVQMAQSNKVKSKNSVTKQGMGNLSRSGSGHRISRIICEDNVVITRKQSLAEIKANGQQQAFSDRADYDFAQSKIVMTGKRPSIKRGTDKIEGNIITIWRDKERLQAKGDCQLSFIAPDNKKIKKPTIATSDFMDMNYAKNLAQLTGNVKVVDSRMKIDCHKMNIYLEDRAKQKSLKTKKITTMSTDKALSSSKAINRIVCLGDVTILRLDDDHKAGTQKATSGKAIYHLKEGKIILSENNPLIIRGRDSISGEIITVWVDQQKMHVDQKSLIVLNSLKNNKGQQSAATLVNSDYTNIDYGRNLMSFAGQVKVKNPQLLLDCKKMLIFLEDKKTIAKKPKVKITKATDPLNMKSSAKEVSKIICLGDVYARDPRNKVNCQKLTLIMQDKENPSKQKTNLGGNREISQIICKKDVVLVRQPDPVSTKTKAKKIAGNNPSAKIFAGQSDQPIIVKTDLMDLQLTKNYGELIGNVDIDEPKVNLKCDKMELYAENVKSPKKVIATPHPDDEFDNETDHNEEVASGDGAVPKKISLGDDKQLEKIVCLKNVVITRKITANDLIKQQATGDKAVYFVKKGKLELTEKPELHQGDNVLHGTKITLWTDSERLDIQRGDVKELELPNK